MDITLTVRYLDDLANLGVTIPDATARARDVYDAAVLTASAHPSDDLKAQLEAGTVTPDNVGELVYKAAADLTAKQNAHQIVRDLQLTLNKAMRQGLRDNEHRIVADLRATFKPAADGITKAAQHFGPGTTSDQVISAPAEVIAAWNATASQAATLDTVSAAYRSLLNDVTNELPTGEDMVSLFVTGKTVNLDHAASLYRGPDKWLALAHAGFKLRLNSPAEARAVVASAADLKAKQAEAERALRLAEHRRQHMPLGLR